MAVRLLKKIKTFKIIASNFVSEQLKTNTPVRVVKRQRTNTIQILKIVKKKPKAAIKIMRKRSRGSHDIEKKYKNSKEFIK